MRVVRSEKALDQSGYSCYPHLNKGEKKECQKTCQMMPDAYFLDEMSEYLPDTMLERMPGSMPTRMSERLSNFNLIPKKVGKYKRS